MAIETAKKVDLQLKKDSPKPSGVMLTLDLERKMENLNSTPLMVPSKKDPKEMITFTLRDVLKEALLKWHKDFEHPYYNRPRAITILEVLFSEDKTITFCENEKAMLMKLFDHLSFDNVVVANFLNFLS